MMEHGVPKSLSARVRRIVAPNPSVMTGDGTNTYLLGEREVAVVDPGPAIPAHIDAILAAGADCIKWIVCTHTHTDHSPAWQAIARETGAEVLGALPVDDQFQDDSFSPDRELVHDALLSAPEFSLRAVHTPGHVDNHYCLFLEEEGILFAGDHIMNGSTVVIIPPGGDMKAYIESLELLLDYPLTAIAPGHGELIDRPREVINSLIRHRLQRESKVVSCLRRLGEADLDALVAAVYDDVDPGLHKMARLSLLAHLLKLEQEQRAARDAAENWRYTGE